MRHGETTARGEQQSHADGFHAAQQWTDAGRAADGDEQRHRVGDRACRDHAEADGGCRSRLGGTDPSVRAWLSAGRVMVIVDSSSHVPSQA